jgi:hypothetical protein
MAVINCKVYHLPYNQIIAFCPQIIFIGFVPFSKQRARISLRNIDWLVLVMAMQGIFYKVETTFHITLNVTNMVPPFQEVRSVCLRNTNE